MTSSSRDVSPQAPSSSSVFVLRSKTRLGAADDAVADQERQDVVAVLALRLRHVHLEAVVEVPERLGAVAVVDEPVERREQRRAIGHRPVGRVGVGVPAASSSSRTPCARKRRSASIRSASRSGTVSVSGYQRSARSQSRWPLRRPDDGDDAPRCRGSSSMSATWRLPHQGCGSRGVAECCASSRESSGPRARAPAGGGACSAAFAFRNSLPRRSWACFAPRAAHPRADERQVLDRPDEGVATRRASSPSRAAGRARRGS